MLFCCWLSASFLLFLPRDKNWSQDEVVKYTQEAYNTLRSKAKTGIHSVEINGEIINVFIKDDGTFDTAYGVYQYTVDDFR